MSADPVRELQALLGELQARTAADAAAWWARLPRDATRAEITAHLAHALDTLARGHGDLADEVGQAFVAAYRELTATPTKTPPVGSHRASPQTLAALADEVADLLAAGDTPRAEAKFMRQADSLVSNRARDAVRNSAKAAGRRYARVPNHGACRFCRMLATRGAVYHSRESAGAGDRFHANCRCTIVEVPAGTPTFYGMAAAERARAEDRTRRLGPPQKPDSFVPQIEGVDEAGLPPVPGEDEWLVNLVGVPRRSGMFNGGHGHGAGRPTKTEVPETWTRQDWEDAWAATITDPDVYVLRGDRRVFLKDFHGVIMEAGFYPSQNGEMQFAHIFPRCGRGVIVNYATETGEIDPRPVPYTLDALELPWRHERRAG